MVSSGLYDSVRHMSNETNQLTSMSSEAVLSYTVSNPRKTYTGLPAWFATHVFMASLIVLFCSASVRLFMIMRADPNQLVTVYSDAPTYITPAESMIDRGAFLNNQGKPMITRTPGYPAFLAAIMLLVGRDLRSVLFAQVVILSLGPLILYWLARRILPPVMAITGGLIASFSPWGAVLAGAPMSDGLFLFLLTAIFFLMKIVSNYRSRKALPGAALIGLLTGLAVLVKPIWPLIILT